MAEHISIRFTMWKCTKLRVSPGCLLSLAVSLLMGAGAVLPVIFAAAFCHEMGHLAALWLFGIPVESVEVGLMGAVIRAPRQSRLSYGQELVAVLAGCAVNFLLAFLFARVLEVYLFAGANFILGVYNLLPIRGLDGGRALYLLIAWATEPFTAQRICDGVNLVALALLLALVLGLVWQTGGGLLFLLAVGGMCLGQRGLPKSVSAGRRKRKGTV